MSVIETVHVGAILGMSEARRLPDGSIIRRVDGPKAPYAPQTRIKGLWCSPRRPLGGGIGTADWEVMRIGWGH